MTLDTAINQAWEALGEPSDLNPSKVGIDRLRDAANDAQDVLAMWVDNRGRRVRFRELEAMVPFTTVVYSDTLTDVPATAKAIKMPVSVLPSLGRFDRWILKIGDEARKVVTSVVSGGQNVLNIGEAFSTTPAGTETFTLSKVEYQFTGVDAIDTNGVRVVEVQRVFDPEQDSMLEEVGTREFLYAPGMGTPSTWRHANRGVQFDVAPDVERSYEMHVTRMPTLVDQLTDEFELPEAFCQAIVLRMVWWGFRRMQDFQAAYATKQEFSELMMRLASAYTLNEEPDYFTVRSR